MEASTMIGIEAIASAFPSARLDNEELRAAFPDWDFDRLEKRTGVIGRYIAAESETALDLAERACHELATRGNLRPAGIDALVVCTQSPDYLMTPNSCVFTGRLERRPEVLVFDINLACSVYI